jgi:hypothetical protein
MKQGHSFAPKETEFPQGNRYFCIFGEFKVETFLKIMNPNKKRILNFFVYYR